MSGYYRDNAVSLLNGDVMEVLKELPELSIQCCVTSPPYWGLRDYGVEGQLGLEKTPEEYVAKMVEVFREVKRVLKADGTLWLNLGDSYAGSGKGRNGDGHHSQGTHWKQSTNRGAVNGVIRSNQETPELKPKDLVGIPWRVAFALQAAGWYLRDAVIWKKPNPMPGSQRDRCTSSYEFVFQLTKRARYFWDMEAIREEAVYGYRSQETAKPMEGRNAASSHVWRHAGNLEHEIERGPKETGVKYLGPETGRIPRNVWTIPTHGFSEAHFATFPPALPERCIKATTSDKGCCAACGWVPSA